MNSAECEEKTEIRPGVAEAAIRSKKDPVVILRQRVTIVWKTEFGARESTVGSTQIVGREGATVVTPDPVPIGAHVSVTCGKRKAECLVVGQIGITQSGHICAVKFIGEHPNFWSVVFPPGERHESKFILDCLECANSKRSALTEFEILALEANGAVAKLCEGCGGTRQFKGKDESLKTEQALPTDPNLLPFNVEIQHFRAANRVCNDRKHKRMSMKDVKGCVRVPNEPYDVVMILDVSRGGVKFSSDIQYHDGMWVELATNYIDGGNNIFVPAKIVRTQRRPTRATPGEYGAEIKKNSFCHD